MKVSLVGLLDNAADALDAFDRHLGGEDADGENADTIYEHQPRMLSYTLRETAKNVDAVRADPAVLEEFLTLYCMRDQNSSDKSHGDDNG